MLIYAVDTGSEDTFREMLRIKRSVQASYNTESSFIAAQTAAARKGAANGDRPTDTAAAESKDAADPMAGLEREAAAAGAGAAGKARGPAPSFVASTLKKTNANGIDEQEGGDVAGNGETVNPEAIDIEDDDE